MRGRILCWNIFGILFHSFFDEDFLTGTGNEVEVNEVEDNEVEDNEIEDNEVEDK